MKIIIEINDIPRNDHERWALSHGTPLLKNHGDLIDRTEVIKSLFDYHNGKKTIGQCIDDVPTIIDADSEGNKNG